MNVPFRTLWSFERTLPGLSIHLLRGGPAFAQPGAWQANAHIRSDYRHTVSGDLGAQYQVEDITGAVRENLNGGLQLRPPGPRAVAWPRPMPRHPIAAPAGESGRASDPR